MRSSDTSLGGLPIAAGDVLLRKYRVERLIGEGGTGIVVAATHLQLEQRVALKFLRRALDSDELRTRFEREARAIGRIESDHVVLVLDAGALDDGAPYMVMEYLDGRDLARVLKEDGPLPVEQAVDCMLQVCEALRKAHAAGIVHRDLKPANLFLTRRVDDDGVHVKVVDFGISKILDRRLTDDGKPHEVTSAFDVLGSPRYMAPEQIRSSRDVDGRADLWSVGAVLFQLVTGRHAFDAEGNVHATVAVLSGEPQRLCALAPHAPRELEAVVARCLEKDVTRRFQSAIELADALRPFASDRAKESLDRIQRAKEAPNLRIALEPRSVPTAPPRATAHDPAVLAAPGVRDAATERKIRVSGLASRGVQVDPESVPALSHVAPVERAALRGRHVSKLALVGLGFGAFAVVFGGFVAFRLVAASAQAKVNRAGLGADRPSAVLVGRTGEGRAATPPAKVTLDAGRASP
jgi:serine/threonine-protein kinase